MNQRSEIGYCLYCKNAIYEGEDYVVRGNAFYHTNCYELIETDTFGVNAEDYNETDAE